MKATVVKRDDVAPGGAVRVRGLVLVGGRSTRMGRDKDRIEYAGISSSAEGHTSAARRAVEALRAVCVDVHLATRFGQDIAPDVQHVPRIVDRQPGIGPVAGIYSAFAYDRNSAWFVVACDLPLLTAEDVYYLFARRDPSKIATTAVAMNVEDVEGGRSRRIGPEANSRFPEPLCTIWEPLAYQVIETSIASGMYSPQALLRRLEVQLVELPNTLALYNANTPEEAARARALIGLKCPSV